MLKSHQHILEDWVSKRYREPWIDTYECVGWVKKYCEEAYWITGLSFWWSAYNGWDRKWNLDTFFDRITVPQTWDIIFFDKTPTNKFWHVAIVDTWKMICEQNGGAGSGTWLGKDAIRIAKSPANILGYMRNKETEVQRRVREFADRHWIQGRSTTQPYTQFEVLSIISLFHD